MVKSTDFKILNNIVIILCIGLMGFNVFGSITNKNLIEIKSEFGKVICPTGNILNLPKGLKLEVVEQKFGHRSIVRVPKSLNKKCSYGILTYSPNLRAGISSVDLRENAKLMEKFSIVAEKMNYADRCKDEFIGEEGLGDWGRYVKKELSSKTYNSLLKNSKIFQNVCPGYALMKNEERKNLWVFVLMSMSHYESSCRPNVEAQGPNGIAKGLFQLHDNFENKYSHWDLDGICKKGGARNPKDSLKCTLSMLNGQIEKYNSLFFKKSYWDVLRNEEDPIRHASKIKNAIGMLKGCESRTIASKNVDDGKMKNKKL